MSKNDNFEKLNSILSSCKTKTHVNIFENWIDERLEESNNDDDFLTWVFLKGRLSEITNLMGKDE